MANKKGPNFERYISKQLSLWLSNGERDDLFWKTHGSGSRYTTRKKLDKETYNQDGDITSTHPQTNFFSSKFSVECKSYKKVELWKLISNSKTGLITWWKKIKKEAEENNKYPILIIKKDNYPILWISNFELNIREIMTAYIDNEKVYIYKLEDIINSSPKTVFYWDLNSMTVN